MHALINNFRTAWPPEILMPVFESLIISLLYSLCFAHWDIVFHCWRLPKPRNLKWGIGSFLIPVLTLWGGSHFYCNIWRVTECTYGFDAICAHYHCCVFYHAITYKRAWFKSMQESQLMLNKIVWRALLRKNCEVYMRWHVTLRPESKQDAHAH